MNSQKVLKISARVPKKSPDRISQGDIFSNIEIIEGLEIKGNKLIVNKVCFPYVVCLNQECDLENDYNSAINQEKKDCRLMHLAIAPAFNFEQFLSGKHWGELYDSNEGIKRSKSNGKAIIDNQNPRYHYLKFPEVDKPELIVDFKHFFTVNRDSLYKQIDKRLYSLDNLFREKLSQRFCNYVSRIGLPVEIIDECNETDKR